MARSAWHVLNDQGACGTYGDSFGNDIAQNLLWYYAYDYSELHVLKVDSVHLES